jgi:hypothetical protein
MLGLRDKLGNNLPMIWPSCPLEEWMIDGARHREDLNQNYVTLKQLHNPDIKTADLIQKLLNKNF